MGIRGELFTTKMSCEGRTYFFNVKENRMGDVFLSIVESKPTETDSFDRRSIVIFRDDMKNFLDAFKSTLKYMEEPELQDEKLPFNPSEALPGGSAKAGAAKAAAAVQGGDEAAGAGRKRRVVVRRKSAGPKEPKEGGPDSDSGEKS